MTRRRNRSAVILSSIVNNGNYGLCEQLLLFTYASFDGMQRKETEEDDRKQKQHTGKLNSHLKGLGG